jgi:hypothetical protein
MQVQQVEVTMVKEITQTFYTWKSVLSVAGEDGGLLSVFSRQ